MANNVLIVNSSSRPNGHTARLCNAFIEGLKEAGKQYTLYETEGKNIAPCKGCGACARKCPVKAISGEPKKPYAIDPAKCIGCGSCEAACRFGAVAKA